jgi:hypothetical protein
MLLQQIQQLQKTVQQLQTGQAAGAAAQQAYSSAAYGGAGAYGAYGAGQGGGPPGTQGYSNYQGGPAAAWPGPRAARPPLPKTERADTAGPEGVPEGEQRVLLVSNIPQNLANPDSLFYAFEKFGCVQRVKILHNKRNTALIQMAEHSEAQRAIAEQEKLNRVGTEIYVNFSNKFREIRAPEPGSMYDDGLTKDVTGEFPCQGQAAPALRQPGFGTGGGGLGGCGGGLGFGGMGARGGGYGDYGDMGRGGGQGCVVLLVSNIPEELANVTNIFNMVGMYGDVVAVKVLRNKPDCCMVQLAKPHHAQQVAGHKYSF